MRDNRVFPRVDLDGHKLRVQTSSLATFLDAYAANISTAGMFVPAEFTYPEGSEFDFVFILGDEERFEGTGRIAWIKPETESSPGGMGIEFVRLTPTARVLVDQIVATHIREKTGFDPDTFGQP